MRAKTVQLLGADGSRNQPTVEQGPSANVARARAEAQEAFRQSKQVIARALAQAAHRRETAVREARAAAEADAADARAELARVQADAEWQIAAQVSQRQAERERAPAAESARLPAKAEERLAVEVSTVQAEAEHAHTVELARLRAEAEENLAAKISALQTETERAHAAQLARVRAEADQHLAAEIARVLAEATAQRDAAVREARAAAEAETLEARAEVARLQADADQRSATADAGFDQALLAAAALESRRLAEAATAHQPKMIVQEFAAVARGAAPITRLQTDPRLSNSQMPVPSQASDIVQPVFGAPASELEPATPTAGGSDTRLTLRFGTRAGVKLRLAGKVATVVDLSPTGAQVVVPTALQLGQRVRISLEHYQQVLRLTASVAWASFERSPEEGPHYRVGLQFMDLDPETIQAFCTREAHA